MMAGRAWLVIVLMLCLAGNIAAEQDTWVPMHSGLTGGSSFGYPTLVSGEIGYMWGPLVAKAEIGLGAYKFDIGYGMRQQRDSGGALPFTRGFSASLSIMNTWALGSSREKAAMGLEIRGHYNLFAVKTGFYFALSSEDSNIFYIAAGVIF